MQPGMGNPGGQGKPPSPPNGLVPTEVDSEREDMGLLRSKIIYRAERMQRTKNICF